MQAALLLTACLFAYSCTPSKTITARGTAMLPGIKDGDSLAVEILVDKSRKLARADIVVFRYPLDPSQSYIRRVIGVPDDEIEMKTGIVWINGQKLDEPYLSPSLNVSARSLRVPRIQPHTYFLMSDNRDNSADSRLWGPVAADLIEGRIVKN